MTALKSPTKIHIVDFFTDLVKLSYIGDFRTYMKAEKKEKANNIVQGALNFYIELYKIYFTKYKIKFENDYLFIDQENLEMLFSNLNENLALKIMINSKNYFADNKSYSEFFIKRLDYLQRRILLENYIKKQNLKFSIYQIIAGLISADITKSVIS